MDALEKDLGIFKEYVRLHMEKTPSDIMKAKRNQIHVDRVESRLRNHIAAWKEGKHE